MSDIDTDKENVAQADEHAATARTTIKYNHYVQHFEIYDKDEEKYVPWDPETASGIAPDEDPDNWFHVTSRYKDEQARPVNFLSQWSKPLLRLLRASIGGLFFDEEPICEINILFPRIEELKNKLSDTQMALSVQKQRVDLAESLGILHVQELDTSGGDLNAEFKEIVEHLEFLLNYLEEQFRPNATRLELEKEHGLISFDLLGYFFKPKQVLYFMDEDSPVAFIVKNTYTSIYNDSPNIFNLQGFYWIWDGQSYTMKEYTTTILEFRGTTEISQLPIKHLDSKMKDLLAARGRKYVSLRGVHYKLYRGMFTGVFRSYNSVNKKWGDFVLEELKPVVFDDDAWDHLVLDPDVKTLIKALVDSTRNELTSTKLIGDVISGKGGGLVALLHGPPGTGKTLTAEAVAEILQRPLYMVGSGELSVDAYNLEQNLKRILKLAASWDAVLLIDEADVYLERRSLHELSRNALVSVALRVLEYHRGVLFLTTNRIKSFDDAFLSRFSVAISYPELDQNGRLAIWSNFLELAGTRVVNEIKPGEKNIIRRSDLLELANRPFNGRTIKNIVRTAQALALSWNTPLSINQINVVVRAQEKFLIDFAQTPSDEPTEEKKESKSELRTMMNTPVSVSEGQPYNFVKGTEGKDKINPHKGWRSSWVGKVFWRAQKK
ncbi:hypothetical protein VKT23_019780 [Stygiomarasmius scandens]|uniref:AAA+ ATPase domain-containing protein n=1 Tax=Marasmiellus scandens TaxID=2682957 RepID=A0ABR1IPV7_9AGAR